MRADENTKRSDGYRDEKIEKCLDMLIDLLDGHINRGIFVISNMRQEGDLEFDKYRCASLMLLHAGISLVGIKKYYRPITLQSKDVIVIFRPVFEGILNCLYVLSSEPDVAHRALKHAAQKPYRRAGEEFRVGSFRIALSMNSEIPD